MKGFWKKLHRKTAVVLTTAMLFTSVVPMTGMAQNFDLGFIDDQDLGENLDGYVATASVAAKVDKSQSDSTIELASGSDIGTATVVVQTEVKVMDVATSSDAEATDSDWKAVKDEIAQVVAGNVTMKATISDADELVADYVSLDSDQLNSDGSVTVEVDAVGAGKLPEGKYAIHVAFTPEVDESGLPKGIVISSSDSAEYEITVVVKNGTVGISEIIFKDFDTGEDTENTWIYVGDKPVDLRDYCTTEFDVSDVSFRSDDPSVASIDGSILTPEGRGTAVIIAEIEEGGQIVASGKLTVAVWVMEETDEGMPPAFEIYENGTWEYTFKGRIASKDSRFTAVLKEDGTVADEETEARVKIITSEGGDNTTTVEVKGKKAGKYTLRCAWHGGVSGDLNNTTQYGYVDFTVKEASPLKDLKISFKGFHADDKVNEEGVMTTWTYRQQGLIWLSDFCTAEAPADAVVTFKSSDPDVAAIDDAGWLYPGNTGETTITATVTAKGYAPAAATLIVQVWDAKEQDNLPNMITMHEGETWTQTFAEAPSSRTKVSVYDDNTGELADKSTAEAFFSEDFKTLTVKAQAEGSYRLVYSSHKEENYTTKYEEMYIEVLGKDVNLVTSADQLILEPGESKTIDVTYSPADAQLDLDYDEAFIKAAYADGKITVTASDELEESEATRLYIWLNQGENYLTGKGLKIYIAPRQLETTTVEEALKEAVSKIDGVLTEFIPGFIPPELYKIVDEVAEIIASAPKSEIEANKEAMDQLEEKLSEAADLRIEVHDDTEIEVSGALLNLLAMGEPEGKMIVKPVEDASNASGVTLDIKLQRGSNGKNITALKVPMQLKLKVSGIDLTQKVRIRHTRENGTKEWIYPVINGEYIVFWVESYSTFAISNYTTSSGSGGGGGSSRSTSAAGVVTRDPKKGQINSLTGIITGSGAGYSNWNQDENGWKLQYADGTFVAGSMVTDEAGNTYEQVAWEMINGAWYPFGANGYVKSGLVYDAALGGTFYININTGMQTGWQQVDGAWRYFSPVSDGKRGIMLVNTTVDGYYINEEGIWK